MAPEDLLVSPFFVVSPYCALLCLNLDFTTFRLRGRAGLPLPAADGPLSFPVAMPAIVQQQRFAQHCATSLTRL